MSNLVAYDMDSDDESPGRKSSEGFHAARGDKESPASEKSTGGKKRKDSDMYEDDDFSPRSDRSDNSNSNFAEPPPPKRVVEEDHSPSPAAFRTPQMMPHTSSQASLVSYSGDGDEDDEAKPAIDSTPQSELHEPQPPARKSQDSDSEEEERLIDMAVKEGQAVVEKDGCSPMSSDTPDRESMGGGLEAGDSPKDTAEPDLANEDEIRIPPPPDVEVSESLQKKFEIAFQQKAIGTNMNQRIQSDQNFNNPMSYESFIGMFEIDEKGTNFPPNIFDPHCFPESCFYERIGEEQKKMMDHQHITPVKKPGK